MIKMCKFRTCTVRLEKLTRHKDAGVYTKNLGGIIICLPFLREKKRKGFYSKKGFYPLFFLVKKSQREVESFVT